MLYSEKHRNSTAGPLVLRGDSSSNSGPSPSRASSFPSLFWLASRGKPLEFEIQIPTAVGIQNSAILLVSASPITTAQAKACMSGASRRKFKSWFLTAICLCGFQPGSGWLFHGRHVRLLLKQWELDVQDPKEFALGPNFDAEHAGAVHFGPTQLGLGGCRENRPCSTKLMRAS